jgi:hypothetical protein
LIVLVLADVAPTVTVVAVSGSIVPLELTVNVGDRDG